MYRDSYQRGMLTIFYSVGAKPLAMWDTVTRDGYITRFLDNDIKSMVLEIGGTNVSTTYMTCPKGNAVLGITMPFLIMVVKNLRKYFSFEVTILDETGTRRRFRISNFQSTTQILPLCTVMPIGLTEGWNQIQFNLADFTRRAYKKQFVEVQKVKINANIRLRRVYFAERLVPDEQLPAEYKLFFPIPQKTTAGKEKKTTPVLKQKESQLKQTQSEQAKQQQEPQQQELKQRPSQLKKPEEHRSQEIRHKQQFQNVEDDDDKIPDIKKKPVGSVQVLKNVSTIQDLNEMDERMSKVLEVPGEPVEIPLAVEDEPDLEVTGAQTELFKNNETEAPVKSVDGATESVQTEAPAQGVDAATDNTNTGYDDGVSQLIDEIEGF